MSPWLTKGTLSSSPSFKKSKSVFYTDLWHRLALSRPYKFIVGPNNTQFYIHTILVAAQSRVLAALIHGNMREATNRRVRWPHVSEETFDHFVEFLYTQNYHSDEEVRPTVDVWMRELIPFTYENTLPSENDKLRSLVSMCGACMRRVPQYGAAFEKLEEDNVDFREAVSKLHRTISELEDTGRNYGFNR